jgi:hypothetical protein
MAGRDRTASLPEAGVASVVSPGAARAGPRGNARPADVRRPLARAGGGAYMMRRTVASAAACATGVGSSLADCGVCANAAR